MAFRLKYFNFFLTRFIIFLYGSYVRSVTGDIDLKTIYLDQINQNEEKYGRNDSNGSFSVPCYSYSIEANLAARKRETNPWKWPPFIPRILLEY